MRPRPLVAFARTAATTSLKEDCARAPVVIHCAQPFDGRIAEGDALRAEARTWLDAGSVREPDIMLEMLSPGPTVS